jgi:hypothetical protein
MAKHIDAAWAIVTKTPTARCHIVDSGKGQWKFHICQMLSCGWCSRYARSELNNERP